MRIVAMMGWGCVVAVLLSRGAYCGIPTPGVQVEMDFETEDGAKVGYLLYLPKDYDRERAGQPLMLFLHGRGESNGPLSLVAKWGPPRMVERGDELPYILVSPQCPTNDNWTSETQQRRIKELLSHVIKTHGADESRVYLTGLSMGGFGSWKLAADQPSRFAAVVPICGGGDPSTAAKLVDLPIWVWHGDKDTAVPLRQSVEMVDAIKAAGGESVRFTVLEEVGHNSWSAAYATPELFEWINKHTR